MGRNITRYYDTRAAGSLSKYFLIIFFRARNTLFLFSVSHFPFHFLYSLTFLVNAEAEELLDVMAVEDGEQDWMAERSKALD